MSRARIHGFGMIETLMAAAIAGIMAAGTLGAMKYFSLGISTGAISARTVELHSNLTRAVGNLYNLRFTSDRFPTSAFSKCVRGGNPGTNECDASGPFGVEVYSAPAMPGAATTRLVGTPQNPVRYSSAGALCAGPGPSCPLRAYATFQPVCLSGARCDQAAQIKLQVILDQDPGIRIPNSMSQVGRKVSSDIPISVRDIASLGAVQCPSGSNLQGFDGQGQPICVDPNSGAGDCTGLDVFGSIRLSRGQLETRCRRLPAAFTYCPAGQVANGFDMSTNQPHCVPIGEVLAQLPSAPPCEKGYVAKGFDLKTNTPICEPAGVYQTSGAVFFAGNPGDPCTALENHDSSKAYRQHWTGVARCNSGDKVVGGGGACQGLMGGVTLTSRPEGSDGWFVDCCVYNDGRLPNPLPTAVYAVCLKIGG